MGVNAEKKIFFFEILAKIFDNLHNFYKNGKIDSTKNYSYTTVNKTKWR